MTYQQTLQYLYNATPAFHQVGAGAYKPGLQNTERLMDLLGHPERKFRSVHIAGTNGKGSTSHLIASTLQAAGLRVGLYTSPHLVDFRERIRINGEMIPQERVISFVAEHMTDLEDIRPSFFEITMAMAFQYFAEQQVDIAVIEVGLGGRLDSTNIITPVLSVITNIGMDHTEFLGNTLAEIASEKAGIIKPDVPIVIGETHPETEPVFRLAACQANSPIFFADQQVELLKERLNHIHECELHGAYQKKNMQTAYVALRQLAQMGIFDRGHEDAVIADGFAHVCSRTGLRGRWEIISHTPCLTICDTGHNSHGIQTYIEDLHAAGQVRIVFGMVADKDVSEVVKYLPHEAVYYWTQPDSHRALSAAELANLGATAGLHGQVFTDVRTALAQARKEANTDDLIFIGGSNYLVGAIL